MQRSSRQTEQFHSRRDTRGNNVLLSDRELNSNAAKSQYSQKIDNFDADKYSIREEQKAPDPRLQLIINDTEPNEEDDEAVPMNSIKQSQKSGLLGDDVKSSGGMSVRDDMRRFLNKRASKSPMGRDSEMDKIDDKLKSLNQEVQGLYNTNLALQRQHMGENADNVSVHDNRSDMGRSPMNRSNFDGRSAFGDNKSNIRGSEVDRK